MCHNSSVDALVLFKNDCKELIEATDASTKELLLNCRTYLQPSPKFQSYSEIEAGESDDQPGVDHSSSLDALSLLKGDGLKSKKTAQESAQDLLVNRMRHMYLYLNFQISAEIKTE